MIRKMGGFSFQELNLAMDDIKGMGENGADLSYDFVTRPAYHHALVTGDTEFLRLTLNLSRELGIDPASLVHALQNHDELTHELVHFSTRHRDDPFTYRGETLTGCELGERVRAELNDGLTGPGKAYNRRFTQNGIACTTATVIAATLGIEDLGQIAETERDRIRDVHLLLAMFNALQPGVFALSGWDLAGMLTVDAATVADLIADGDTRWINRGAHDLRGVAEPAREGRMPAARSLYGTLSEQLADPDAFASRLRRIIAIRNACGIATAIQIDVPDVSHRAALVLVHRLADETLQLTVLNFSGEEISGSVRSEHLPAGARVENMFTDEEIGIVDDLHSFALTLAPYQGTSLRVAP
jgi:trehalose synthase